MKRHDEFRHLAAVVAISAAMTVATPGPAIAQTESPAGRAPGEVIEETTRRVLEIFQNLMGAIPQYEAPVVLDNGDILIKRKRPEPESVPPPGGEAPTRTRT